MSRVTLGPGSRLGPYEIIESIGAGGMGVVYRARDTHLHRTVALKVLGDTPDIAGARDHLLGEARAASALNHPSICTVHEVREAEGHVFIVMECVLGRPLHELIPVDGLPAEAVLRYGIQIADALVHAHDRGVLHRDLKSANVIVSPEGQVKIVDFGLASRFTHAALEEATESNVLLDQHDRLAGTLAYMAPEVLHGDAPAVSSDLWALGVLLFEMASGHLPFTGRTGFELTAAVLRAPLPALPAHVPPSIRMVISRCLAKAPGQRYQSAREVRAALEAVQSDVAIVPLARPAARRRFLVPALAAAVLLGALALATVVLIVGRRRPPGEPARAGQLLQVLASDRQAYDPALSHDGTMIAYVAQDEAGRFDLFASRVAGGGRVRLTNDEAREAHPRFSPDGERVAFARRRLNEPQPEICIVPALGGEVALVVRQAAQPAWSPDGRRLAFVRVGGSGQPLGIVTARADGTELHELILGDGIYPFIRSPAWSPDGSSIAFVRGTGGVAGEIWVMPSGGGSPRRVSSDAPAVFSDEPVFTADGRAIVHASNRGGATNIWALPLDGDRAVRLTTGPGPDESPTVDRAGRIAFTNVRWRTELAVHSPAGPPRTLARHTPFLWAPAFSPDGAEIAFSRSEVDGSWHIWIADVGTGSSRRLTSGELGELYPRWSRDGRSLLYHTWGPPYRVWRVSRDGGPPEALTPPGIHATFGDLSPDGRRLAFVVADQKLERVFLMSLADPTSTRMLRASAASLPRWSPDGAWIAFAPDRGYDGGIFLIRPDGTAERRLTDRGGWPVWWPDGRRIGFLRIAEDGTQQIASVAVDGSQPPVTLPFKFEGSNHPFDVARDGVTMAIVNAVHVSSEIWVLEPRS